jgi:phosphohistidine phosphatase
LLDLVHEAPDGASSLLLVGHNPGLEQLVLLLVPDQAGDVVRDRVEEKYPTASLAEIALDVAHWADVSPGGGRLTRFVRPRDLDPALGPDLFE